MAAPAPAPAPGVGPSAGPPDDAAGPKRPPDEQGRHDAVVEASAAKWGDLSDKGLVVTVNPGDEQRMFAGPHWSPRYPDVVIWQPEGPGADHGTPIILEEVETASTVTDEEAEQWRDFGELYAHRFNLVVPKDLADEAVRLAEEHGVILTEVIAWSVEGERCRFQSVETFP